MPLPGVRKVTVSIPEKLWTFIENEELRPRAQTYPAFRVMVTVLAGLIATKKASLEWPRLCKERPDCFVLVSPLTGKAYTDVEKFLEEEAQLFMDALVSVCPCCGRAKLFKDKLLSHILRSKLVPNGPCHTVWRLIIRYAIGSKRSKKAARELEDLVRKECGKLFLSGIGCFDGRRDTLGYTLLKLIFYA